MYRSKSKWSQIRQKFKRRIIFFGILCFCLTLVVLNSIVGSSRYVYNDERLCAQFLSDRDIIYPGRGDRGTKLENKVTSVSCLALMEGDGKEKSKAELHMQFNPYRPVSAARVAKEAENCDEFIRNKGYDSYPVSDEEKDFPVAFSILVHRDVDQLERLLRNIYRTHNFYCIHVDANSIDKIIHAVTTISKCFSNIFIPPKLEAITYAHFSRLQADISCMRELVLRGGTWKYVINLTGQMFPLKTNLEIVKILKTYEGSNDIEGFSRYVSTSMKIRYQYRYEISKKKMVKTKVLKPPPPRNITLVKGSAYGAFSRPFVEYVLEAHIVHEFLNWTSDIYSPDEFFWASLNSRWVNPMFRSPGGHDLPPERKPWMAAYVAWRKKDNCGGKFVRDICIFGVADLPSLIGRKELFANKFYVDFQPLTIDCLEEWLTNKTKHHLPIDLEFYRNTKNLLKQVS